MEEASVSIRLNPFKGLDGPAGTPVPWSPYGRILSERPVFTLDPLFHAGCYYVQDSSAMYVGHLFRKLLAIAGGSGQLPPETSGCAGPLPSDDGPLPLTKPRVARFPEAVTAAAPQRPVKVLDLCAAPGG